MRSVRTALVCCAAAVVFTACAPEKEKCDRIYYTSVSGKAVQPDDVKFDAVIVENTYSDGRGCIRFNKDVTEIKDEAFMDREDLKSVKIPSSVTTIGEDAFAWCVNLDSVAFADGSQLRHMGWGAFSFTAIWSIDIPSSVEKVEPALLAGCTELRHIGGKFATRDGKALVYNEKLIGVATKGLSEYTVGEWVSYIGDGVFFGSQDIETVNLPSTIKAVSKGAFCEMPKLKSVYFSSPRPPFLYDAFEFKKDGTPVIYTPKEHPYGGHKDWYFLYKRGHLKKY